MKLLRAIVSLFRREPDDRITLDRARRYDFVKLEIAALVSVWFLLVAAPAHAQEARILYPALAAGQLLDGHSTAVALGRPNTHEANGLWVRCVQSSSCLYGLKAATAAGEIAAMEFVRRKYPRVAFWVSIGLASASTTIAIHNYRVGK